MVQTVRTLLMQTIKRGTCRCTLTQATRLIGPVLVILLLQPSQLLLRLAKVRKKRCPGGQLIQCQLFKKSARKRASYHAMSSLRTLTIDRHHTNQQKFLDRGKKHSGPQAAVFFFTQASLRQQ
jgi:hypothetical protein